MIPSKKPERDRPRAGWAVGSLSRRTRQRGMALSAMVGLGTLALGFLGHARAKPPETVVVANTSLPAGSLVTAHDVTVEKLPAPGVAHAVTSLRAAVGHRLAFSVAAGQPVVQADLSAAPTLQGLPSGEVAVMLPVSLASSDNVRPGDRVDVIWVGGGTTGQTTETTAPGSIIARGLRVLAVLNQNGAPAAGTGSKSGLNASTPAAVEVAAPVSEAGALAIAAASGRFWLARDPWARSQAFVPTVSPTPATPPKDTLPSSSPTASSPPISPSSSASSSSASAVQSAPPSGTPHG